MRRTRNLAATAVVSLGLIAAVGVSGAGAAAADAMRPMLVRDVREPFTVSMGANAGVIQPLFCQDIPLPAGTLVIENINGRFSGPVDAHLHLWRSLRIGQGNLRVPLAGMPQNLAPNAGVAVEFQGMLVIADGYPTTPDRLFRNADSPVQFCAEDDVANVGQGGSVQISGYILR